MLDIRCLSEEQKDFLKSAYLGKNILVNACIGSGKTTAIQFLCNTMPSYKNILYLTYNRLLKLDAQSKMPKKPNTTVSNYHGYAASILRKNGIQTDVSRLIKKFIEIKPTLPKYDVLIIDEYQDIEQELAEMLKYIKSTNPEMQIIAVGDMEQKIYDKTTLDVEMFIDSFLGDYESMNFTICFRLSSKIADALGRIWGKTIIGVNNDCIVEYLTLDKVVEFLSSQNPSDVLCLGARNRMCAEALNDLEEKYPLVYNKNTVYASIRDEDRLNMTIREDAAIFTTYDSSKGMERKICVVFDFTENYWLLRSRTPFQSYDILRNIFCVAASRGKEHIIFVTSKNESDKEELLSEETLSTRTEENNNIGTLAISNMFDFKYREDIQECFDLLNKKEIENEDNAEIEIERIDGYIDLSPCIGVYQEATFFNGYSVEEDIELISKIHKNKKYRITYDKSIANASLDKKILFYTYLETNQERYYTQIEPPFVKEYQKSQIHKRLKTMFSADETVQQLCALKFYSDNHTEVKAIGFADVIKNNTVFELKFVSELKLEHYLQCACYMVAKNLEKGVLWNIKDNKMVEISIPDKKRFLDSVVKAITKRRVTEYIDYKKEKEKKKTDDRQIQSNETVNTKNVQQKGKNDLPKKPKSKLQLFFGFIKKLLGIEKKEDDSRCNHQFEELYLIEPIEEQKTQIPKAETKNYKEKDINTNDEAEKRDKVKDAKTNDSNQGNEEKRKIKNKETTQIEQIESEKDNKPKEKILIRKTENECFIVIDTETNWHNEVMSIGVVLAETDTFNVIEKRYYIISPEFQVGGMFSHVLEIVPPINKKRCDRKSAINDIRILIDFYRVKSVFAYNAQFDYRHLPELQDLNWYDIMRIAAYKQYNPYLPQTAECYKTGRLKANYGVEPILCLLTDNWRYKEKHNALFDAIDELTIMRQLGRKPCDYILLSQPSSKNKNKSIADCPDIKTGVLVKMKGKGIGKIVEVNENVIVVNYEGKNYTYTRKYAFLEEWLKLIE